MYLESEGFGDCSPIESYNNLKLGTLEATLPDAWLQGVELECKRSGGCPPVESYNNLKLGTTVATLPDPWLKGG